MPKWLKRYRHGEEKWEKGKAVAREKLHLSGTAVYKFATDFVRGHLRRRKKK